LERHPAQPFYQIHGYVAIRAVPSNYLWAQGFITAANALLNTEYPMVKNLTAKISNDEQQKTLDSICRAKPEQDFSRAAMQLLDMIREAEGLQPILK
jgi:hypothetical protein